MTPSITLSYSHWQRRWQEEHPQRYLLIYQYLNLTHHSTIYEPYQTHGYTLSHSLLFLFIIWHCHRWISQLLTAGLWCLFFIIYWVMHLFTQTQITHTELLDLKPLPLSALGNKTYKDFYRFSHFNPIQTQVNFWPSYLSFKPSMLWLWSAW